MANGSFVQVSSGTGPKLATGPLYTENASSVQDEKVILGLPYAASYALYAAAISLATLNSHLIQLMAGASLNVYVLRIQIWQDTLVTTGGLNEFQIVRLSSAGTGGTGVTPAPPDPADAASGATGMTLPTALGTIAAGFSPTLVGLLQQTASASAGPASALLGEWDWTKAGIYKPLKIAAGTGNGISIRNRTAQAAGGITVMVEFAELAF